MHEKLDIPDLLLALMALAPAGFAIGLHVRYQTPTLMFQTYPVAWLAEYSHGGLVMQDPTIGWAAENRGMISWEELKDRDPAGVFERARAHGIVHGFAISLERGGSQSLASFARGDRDFTPEEKETTRALMLRLHEATASAMPLSPETREALRSLSVAFTQP
ncbi:DNA-binding protein HTH domain protein-containing protein [Rubellimicrobium mesophilum DSM 19309]|uniref:DNA-binding protein HTH domain protein-containing protein n=1 Tax=Rubellimicrobium mesophilum DSM 19309 TaxID=442562 RepID=A0A017HRT7_9RHOB|nr:autoinducer binding domain-containing protein [Rubellimicrobium mesophilum]EYD77066.1 DNA-binding protein HTH domain protein-containing protein [Rubellimicrobium mesophilum DSM 19309]